MKVIQAVDAVIRLADPNVNRSAQPDETEQLRELAHQLRDDIEQRGRTTHAATTPLIDNERSP